MSTSCVGRLQIRLFELPISPIYLYLLFCWFIVSQHINIKTTTKILTITLKDLNDLVQLQERLPNSAVLFVRAQDDNVIHELNSSEQLYAQLESIDYLNPKGTRATSWVTRSSRCQLLNSTANFHQHLIPLLRRQARAYLIQASTQLLSMVESCMSRLLGK